MNKFLSLKVVLTCIVFFMLINACKKESFITSSDAYLRTSEDTLHFDTVFTSLGSTTQYLKVFNVNDQKLKLSSVKLMGGAASFFKLNVDGLPGTDFTDIEMEANDSLYMFATVKINPSAANLPFLVRDSIRIDYNGNTRWIQLEAFGKNANFMRNVRVTKDSSLTNNLPIVILGSLIVYPNATLTIPPSTQLYVHANAPIMVYGTLKAVAPDTNSRIVFQGIRIDAPYKDYPGGWPYIYFAPSSKQNQLQHCVIKNAYQGVVVDSLASGGQPKLSMKQCILDNIYDRAIIGNNSSVDAENCLISNVGYGFYGVSGGTYNFNHCTFTVISNYFINHKESLITLSNTNNDKTYSNPLSVNFYNSIIYSEGGIQEDEIAIPKKDDAVAFTVNMSKVLYKQKTGIGNISFIQCYKNINPQFDSVDISKNYYSFKLRDSSPCIDSAALPTLPFDLDGRTRPQGAGNDLGCYEKQ